MHEATVRRLKHGLKIVVSLALLGYALTLIDWRQAGALMRQASLGSLLAVVALLTVERTFSVLKWHLLLRAKAADVSFGRLFIINYVGGFWGLVLPSSVSADIVRGFYLSRATADVSLSVTSMIVDRFMGGFSTVFLGCCCAWWVGDQFGLHHVRAAIGGGALLVALGGAAAMREPVLRRLDQWVVQRLTFRNWNRQIRKWITLCLEYRRYPGVMLASFLLSVLVQVVRVLIFYLVALGFGVHVALTYYFIMIPVIMLVLMLPFSFNGWGIREISFVGLFTLAGMESTHAMAISLTVALLSTLTTAVGGLIYLFDRGAARQAPAENASPP